MSSRGRDPERPIDLQELRAAAADDNEQGQGQHQHSGHGAVAADGNLDAESRRCSVISVMKNELILSMIAPHLPFEDLRRLRETCYAWNVACVPYMTQKHKHAPLILATDDKNAELVADPVKVVKMSEYMEYVESRTSSATPAPALPLPFSNYKIPAPTLVNRNQMTDFFTACGSSTRKLTVDDDRRVWEDVGGENWRFEQFEDKPAEMNMGIMHQIVLEWTPELTDLEILLHEEVEEKIQDQEQRQRGDTSASATQIVKEISKLRRLDVHVEVTPPRGLINLVLDILKNAPGLEHFSLSGIQAAFLQIPSTMLDSSPQLLAKLTCLKLRELGDEEILLLINLATPAPARTRDSSSPAPALRLHELEIQVDTDTFIETEEEDLRAQFVGRWARIFLTQLSEFLQTQATSLRKLKITLVGICPTEKELNRRSPFFLEIPLLPELRYFRRDRIGMGPMFLRFGDETDGDTMGNAFPALQRFVYWQISVGAGVPMETNGADVCSDDLEEMLHPGVTQLKLNVPFDPRGLFALPSRLPAVTHLELMVKYNTRHQISAVWSAWPGLESLTMTIHYHDKYDEHEAGAGSFSQPRKLELDDLLSGIPKSKHGLLRAELDEGGIGMEGNSLERLRQLQAEHRICPALKDLRHLKKFILKGPHTISDIGGFFGLALANPDMQHMTIVEDWKGNGQATAVGVDNGDSASAATDQIRGTSISDGCLRLIKSAFSPQAIIDIDIRNH